MQSAVRAGLSLIEVVVALVLFSVGGLALVATSAVVGRELATNALRERAGRIAETRLEILRSECRAATAGSESIGAIDSRWTVGRDSVRMNLAESITYPTRRGRRSDVYQLTLLCAP